MKQYYDAGLKSLAQAAGYPLPTIQNCSQFKRTLLEAWEALYRVMILKFEQVTSSIPTDIISELLCTLRLVLILAILRLK